MDILHIIKIIGAFIISYYFSIMFHELGHYVFNVLFKVPIKMVYIGFGPAILKIGKIRFGVLPLGGRNRPYSYDIQLEKWKLILIFLGGAIGNLIGIILFPYLPIWILMNVIMIIANLIPVRNNKTISDGLIILALIYHLDFLPYNEKMNSLNLPFKEDPMSD